MLVSAVWAVPGDEPLALSTVDRNARNHQDTRLNLQNFHQGPSALSTVKSFVPLEEQVPIKDFPMLAFVPRTEFSCSDQEFAGYFADTSDEAQCQAFHICQKDGRSASFLCPNGTLFNQRYFVCDWWFNVDCLSSEKFYSLNAEKESPKIGSGKEICRYPLMESEHLTPGVPQVMFLASIPFRPYTPPSCF